MNNGNLDSLITKLREKDSFYSILYKKMYYIYGIFALIFLIFLVLRPYGDITFAERVSGFCSFGAMTIFFLLFRNEYATFSKLDYSLPLLDLLKQAKQRYRLGGNKWIYLIIAVILLDLRVTYPFPADYPASGIFNLSFSLNDQLIYLSVIGASFLIGILVWVFRYKPLVDSIDSMIKDLANG